MQTCDAYKAGIPDDIWWDRVDHRQPQPGDGGVQWESDDGAHHPKDDELTVDVDAINAAFDDFVSGRVEAAAPANFNVLHPRDSKGRFRDTFGRILNALTRWAAAGGKGDPFADHQAMGLSSDPAKRREQLRRVAVSRGVTLKRGATYDDIGAALLTHLRAALAQRSGQSAPAKKAAPAAPTAPSVRLTRMPASSIAARAPAVDAHWVKAQGRGNIIGEVRGFRTLSGGAVWRAYDLNGQVLSSGHGTKKGAADAVAQAVAGGLAPTTTSAPVVKTVSRAVAGVPGVTATTLLPKQPPPGAPSWQVAAKESLEIHLNGVKIGTIHHESYGWNAESPIGGNPVMSGRTKTSAIQALVARHQSRMILQSSITGVTLTRLPAFPGNPGDHIAVDYNGVDVGHAHSNLTGDWTAWPPGGATYGLQPGMAGSGQTYATKDDAVQALVDAHNANQGAPPAAPVPPAASVPPAITVRQLGGRGSGDWVVAAGGQDIGVILKSQGAGYNIHPTTMTGLPNPMPGGPWATKAQAVRALSAAYVATLGLGPAPKTKLTKLPQSYAGSQYAFEAHQVNLGSTNIGEIRRVQGSPSSGPDEWRAYDTNGQLISIHTRRKDAVDALVTAHQAPPPPTPAPVAAPPAAFSPNVKAAQDVLYGIDPKAKTTARQLTVYGALRKAEFDTLDPAEQSTLLGDLSYITTTSKGPNAAQAQKLLDRFAPAGTPVGTTPTPAIIAPAGASSAQTRVADPTGTPGLFSVMPAAKRGKSGDGWTRTASGGSGPWGQYGAAGLMLRHVDDKGVERFLMIERGPGISNPGEWQFPGGAKDEKEDFYQGAAREVVEELGFQLSDLDTARVHGTHTHEVPAVMVPGLQGGQVPWAYMSIAATVDSQLVPDLSTHHAQMETSDAKWMTRAEIEALDRKGKLLRPLAGGQLQQNIMTLFPPPGPARPGATAKRPPRLAGAPTPRTPHKPSRGKDLVADTTARDKLRQDVKQARKRYAGKAADDRLAAIGAMQGFDDTPTVVPKAEIDRLLATGDYIEAWRGVSGTYGKTARQIQEEMRTGAAWYGNGMFGNGFYFTAHRASLQGSGGWTRYGDGTPGSVARVLIPRTAKIIQHRKAQSGAHSIASPYSQAKGRRSEDGTLYDEGRYAAAKGYDMIEVPHGTFQAGHVTAPGKSTWVVLNRSVLIIEEDIGRSK